MRTATTSTALPRSEWTRAAVRAVPCNDNAISPIASGALVVSLLGSAADHRANNIARRSRWAGASFTVDGGRFVVSQ